jgi:hypothetical protein
MGEKQNTSRILVAKQEEKRSRRRWIDNIKTDLREIRWSSRDWIDLGQDRDQ